MYINPVANIEAIEVIVPSAFSLPIKIKTIRGIMNETPSVITRATPKMHRSVKNF